MKRYLGVLVVYMVPLIGMNELARIKAYWALRKDTASSSSAHSGISQPVPSPDQEKDQKDSNSKQTKKSG